jgi:hypothetical protein
VAGSCKHDNGPSVSMNGEFLALLSYCWLLKGALLNKVT